MEKLASIAIDTALKKGATYVDVRIVETRREDLSVRNGEIAELDRSETLGFGVRVIAAGAWGFAASNRIARDELARVAAQAVEVARASARLKPSGLRLAPEPVHRDTWSTPYITDPFAVPLEGKLDLLHTIDHVLRKKSAIAVAESNMSFLRERTWLASSEGTFVDQTLLRSGVGYSATAVGNGDTQIRSYPNSFRGQYLGLGYELVKSLPLVENAERVREEAIALLDAPPCPEGVKDLIVDGSQLALQIHESVGHATELDRVLGMEESYAGSSFATTDKLGKFGYGSPIVNLVADSTVPTGLATIGYDDDGVAAQRWHVVQAGVLQGYLTSRELAHPIREGRSRGCCRAEGHQNIPIIRIPNLSLMPGDVTFEALVKDTRDGIYMETNRCWSIDQLRLNFQFGCEAGWEIKNRKRGRMLKNPSYQSITPKFWGRATRSATRRTGCSGGQQLRQGPAGADRRDVPRRRARPLPEGGGGRRERLARAAWYGVSPRRSSRGASRH
ncbi:MAG: TldD/PmbA family protein [Acidobacteriota bacterium]